MSPQPLSLLAGPRDNSDFETYPRDWLQQQTKFLTLVSPDFSRVEPQLQGRDTGSAVNLSPGQRSRSSSPGFVPGPKIGFLSGQTDQTEAALRFQGCQGTLSECSDVLPVSDAIGTRRSGNANQVDRRDSPLQQLRAPSIGLHSLGSFKIVSPTHSPAISPRMLPGSLLPPMVQNKSELNYLSEVNTHNKRNNLDLISGFQGLGSNSNAASSTKEQFPRYPQANGPDELRSDSGYGGLPTATVGIPSPGGGDINHSGETQSINGHISDIHLRQGLDKGPWSQYVATHSQIGTERIMCSNCDMAFKNKSELRYVFHVWYDPNMLTWTLPGNTSSDTPGRLYVTS